MNKRKAIPKKARFEVFKRDSFTCQYCGRKSPDVLLVIDHIMPVSKGGTNDILNLITACRDCNSGKSDKELSDTSVIEKQRRQLEDLQQRKEQIEMMFQWQKGLLELDDHLTTQLAAYWAEQVPGFSLNDNGIRELNKLKHRYELHEIMTAMKISVDYYVECVEGELSQESVELAWNKIGGICAIRRREKEEPSLQRLYYIRGILRNRLRYVDEGLAIRLLRKAQEAGASLEILEEHAKTVPHWTRWRTNILEFISQQQESHTSDDDQPLS